MQENKKCKPIFGVDPEKEVTPLMVRDAIIECFFQAHCADAEISMEEGSANKNYCQEIVKKAFADSGGDFNNPNKESIQVVLDKLSEFAKKFRDPEMIKKHYGEIMKLVEKL